MSSKLLYTRILDQKWEGAVTVTIIGMEVSQQSQQDMFIKLNCAVHCTGAIPQTR